MTRTLESNSSPELALHVLASERVCVVCVQSTSLCASLHAHCAMECRSRAAWLINRLPLISKISRAPPFTVSRVTRTHRGECGGVGSKMADWANFTASGEKASRIVGVTMQLSLSYPSRLFHHRRKLSGQTSEGSR